MRKLFSGFAALAVMFVASNAQAVGLNYFNDFEVGAGPEWSDNTISTTPVGSRNFLGIFEDETVSLTLDAADNQNVKIAFDLFLIRSWDGNQVSPVAPSGTPAAIIGPDYWKLSVENGPTLLNTTFSVFDGQTMSPIEVYSQAYPDNVPGTFAARTGADESNSLGYVFGSGNSPADMVYHLEYSFLHTTGPLVFNFQGDFPDSDVEEWGLDNVSVEAVPEPSTFVCASLLGLCGIGFGWRRRRKA